jgi:hypothetical protein
MGVKHINRKTLINTLNKKNDNNKSDNINTINKITTKNKIIPNINYNKTIDMLKNINKDKDNQIQKLILNQKERLKEIKKENIFFKNKINKLSTLVNKLENDIINYKTINYDLTELVKKLKTLDHKISEKKSTKKQTEKKQTKKQSINNNKNDKSFISFMKKMF